MQTKSEDIKLQVNGKTASAYLASPKDGGPGILVLHAWWGLKPFFKQACDQLAQQGFTALAPDLYQGRVANTIDEAKALLEQRDFEFMGEAVKAAQDHLVSLRYGRPIGAIGFSMGAAWALILASTRPEQIAATVLFYGNEDADYGKITAKVIGHYSDNDEWEPNEYVEKTFAALKSAGVDATLHIYPGVGHWFVETDRPEYDASAASLAWQRTFDFLKKNL